MLRERESAKICVKMRGPGRITAMLAGALAGGALACGAAGALAATPTAPKLTAKVVPGVVKPNATFKVYLTVTYDKKTTTTHPYLKSYVQFSSAACKQTAKAEAARKEASEDFLGTVTNSPFTRWDRWTAAKLRGTRRVCAYLYAAKSDSKPLLTATATYRVV
jgi:hypothetical protein